MKWEQFKNRFKKDARQQEVDVDVDAIWDAIEPEVDAINKDKPRRKPFPFWILFGGMLVAGMGLWLLYDADNIEHKLVESRTTKVDYLTDSQIITNKSKSESATVLEQNNNIQTKVSLPQPTEQLSTKKSTSIQNLQVSPFKQHQKNEQQKSSSVLPVTHSALDVHLNEALSKIDKQMVSITPDFKAGNKNGNNDVTLKKKAIYSSSKTVKSEVTSSLEPLERIEKETSVLPRIKLYLPVEHPVALNGILGQAVSEKRETDERKVNSAALPPGDNNVKKLSFFASIDGGVSFIHRMLNDTARSVLLEKRLQHETPLEATHYGFSLGVEPYKGFRVGIGMQHTSIAERYYSNATEVTVDSVWGVATLLVNAPGDTIAIMGLIRERTTTKTEHTVYNTYRLIDIPISIGYHHEFYGQWKAGIEAGLFANIALKTKGIILDENSESINIGTEQSSIFKSKVGLGYQVKLSAGRSFYDNKIDLTLSPVIRVYPKSFTIDNYDVSQKYTLIGVNLGLSYRF